MRARFYSPRLGRFLSEDTYKGNPIDPLSLNLYTYCHNNPILFYDPSGNGPERASGSSKGPARASKNWPSGMSQARLDGWLQFSLGAVRNNGIYHLPQDYWQSISIVGFNDLYDLGFGIATSMERAKFQFRHNEQDYIFWAWKGDYLNMGAGAEMGIYYGGGPHWLIDTKLAMHMTLTLQHKGTTIISWNPQKDDSYKWDKVWWVTGFNPNYMNVQASDLTAVFTVTFNTKAMYTDFKNSLNTDEKRWLFDDKSYIASFIF